MAAFKQWWEKSYNNRKERFLLHGLFWILYLCFLSFTAYEHLNINYNLVKLSAFLFWFSPFYLIWVFYFFINTSYVYVRKGRYTKASLAFVAAFLLYIHSDILFSYFQALKLIALGVPSKLSNAKDFSSFYRSSLFSWFGIGHALFGFVLYLILPTLCKFFRDLQRSQRQYNELMERNLQLELSLIKSQMNPHFLLNTLNNIYGLTITGTKQQIGEMLLNLSGFLRYSLYECNHEFIALSKEIKLIQNYIDLEAVRSDFIEISFEINSDSAHYMVPPFVLFPLIENAFKHGAKNLVKSTHIIVALSVAKNKLNFVVSNELQQGETETGGIGLPALRKKIEYYYPGNASFTSAIEGNRYIARLQIDGLWQQ